jgi:RNA polymerase sigma-70 factor (ECF subfamily)
MHCLGVHLFMELSEEKELIEQAKHDQLAFGKLYDAYYPKISRYILNRIGNVQEAQDITSDVFYKIMTGLHKFEWRNISFSSWVYKIATNEITNYYRRKKHIFFSLDILFEKHHFELPDKTNIEQDFIVVEKALTDHNDFLLIQKSLQELPLNYQEVLSLRFFEKKKIQEISEITGKKTNTIKSLLSRGIQKLQVAFQEKKGGENSTHMQPFDEKVVIENKRK